MCENRKYKNLKEFYEECEIWEGNLRGHCCSFEEQKIVSDAFFRLRDRMVGRLEEWK